MFVDERYRGMRLSQRIIDAAAEYARRLGFEYVYLISDHENFYEKYGFENVGTRKNFYHSPTENAIIMIRGEN